MKPRTTFSRRDFVKTSAIVTSAAFGAVGIQSCVTREKLCNPCTSGFPVMDRSLLNADKGVSGLLYSQVGYEIGYPVRIILRLPEKDMLGEDVECILKPYSENRSYTTLCKYWGEIWKSHWWIAEFRNIDETGEWAIEIVKDGVTIASDHCLEVGENILWEKTYPWASVDMLQRRKHFTKVGAGWQDAGTLWVESCAQSAMVIALEEMIFKRKDSFTEEFRDQIYEQITIGCDYLVMLREKATELGYPEGAMSHDLHGHEKDILPSDASKAVIALARTEKILPDRYTNRKQKYLDTARLTFNWLKTEAQPLGDYGFSYAQRGLPESTKIPGDEFQTRDLVLMTWAALEMWKSGFE